LTGAALACLSLLSMLSGSRPVAAAGVALFLAALMVVSPLVVRPIARAYARVFSRLAPTETGLAEGNVSRQPERTTVTASAMLISLAVIVALFTVETSIRSTFQNYIKVSLGSDYLLAPQSLVLDGGNVGAGPELAEKIRAVPGIKAVTSLRATSAQSGSAQLQVIGIDPRNFGQVAGLVFSEGQADQAYTALNAGQAVIVNGIYAAQQHLHPGDRITIRTPHGEQVFKVAGVAIDYLNAKLSAIYISQSDMGAYFNERSDVLIMANKEAQADPAQVMSDLRVLAQAYPAFTLYDSARWRATQMQEFNVAMSLIYVLMLAISLPALIALINTLAINVLERTREIGLLRAVGATQGQVQRMILIESLLLAAFSAGFGILGGVWLGYTLIVATSASGIILTYVFPVAGILITIGLGLILGVIAALVPAGQAARLDVIRALHYE
jgi:putative ABC transport system permease protein